MFRCGLDQGPHQIKFKLCKLAPKRPSRNPQCQQEGNLDQNQWANTEIAFVAYATPGRVFNVEKYNVIFCVS